MASVLIEAKLILGAGSERYLANKELNSSSRDFIWAVAAVSFYKKKSRSRQDIYKFITIF